MNLFEKLKYILRSIFTSSQVSDKDSKDKEYEETSEIIASLRKHFLSLEQNNKEPLRLILLKKLIELRNQKQNYKQQELNLQRMQLIFPQQKTNYNNTTSQRQNQPISTPTFHNQNFDTQNYFIKQHIPQFMIEQKMQQSYESKDQQTFFHQNQLQINIQLESISFSSSQSHFTFGQSNSFGSQMIQQSILNAKEQQTKFAYNNIDCKNQNCGEPQKNYRPKPKLFIFPEIVEDMYESTLLTEHKFSETKETL
ncbi:unnamed protein product [Paramecium pentaurelia]|uniref:Uncharacterized protein n=1 Tax=Paramecium pentaurelia TaxID=43138 RepID=A0A8S1XN92_9CILI|nr:unnamed protein product [Paramecium pentaurelia]